MNTIWLKIAGVAVVVVIVIVVIGRFRGNKPVSEPPAKREQKTFYDMADRDKQFNEPPPVEPQAAQQPQEPAPQTEPQPAPTQPPSQPAGRPAGVVYPSDLKSPTTLYFKPLGEIDDIEAQRILPVATAGRSIGRLPVTHFKLMVDGCRQILERWPDSWYAFRAKQMLEDMPERFHGIYKVTPQELDISRFMKPRQGTEPRTVEPIR